MCERDARHVPSSRYYSFDIVNDSVDILSRLSLKEVYYSFSYDRRAYGKFERWRTSFLMEILVTNLYSPSRTLIHHAGSLCHHFLCLSFFVSFARWDLVLDCWSNGRQNAPRFIPHRGSMVEALERKVQIRSHICLTIGLFYCLLRYDFNLSVRNASSSKRCIELTTGSVS